MKRNFFPKKAPPGVEHRFTAIEAACTRRNLELLAMGVRGVRYSEEMGSEYSSYICHTGTPCRIGGERGFQITPWWVQGHHPSQVTWETRVRKEYWNLRARESEEFPSFNRKLTEEERALYNLYALTELGSY